MFRNAIRAGIFARTLSQRSSNVCLRNPQFLVINRLLNTTDKNKDHHHSTVDVYDPEYLNQKKPPVPKTAEEFADYHSQKVCLIFPPYLELF